MGKTESQIWLNQAAARNRRHVGGWLLIVNGVCLLWLWQNFRETFGGTLYFGPFAVEINTVPFLAGVASLIGGALLARGGWGAQVFRVPLRYVVGLVIAGAVATIVRPTDMTARADTWLAFRMLRPRLNALSRGVPHGLTSMECDIQLSDPQLHGAPDPGCQRIFETRITVRSPTEDSLYASMTDAQVRGFFDIEMRRAYFAVVRIVPSPGVRKGFLKLHQANISALPQQLFLHQVADIYPLGEDWFHFVTR